MEVKFSPSNSSAMSEDVRELMKALLLAEAEFPTLEQTGFNPQFKSKNSKLPDYYKATKASLRKNNIKITHYRTILENNETIVTTRLVHSLSGQWIQDMAILKSEKPGNQGLGAALTYMLKDAVRSLCAVSYGEHDDDGQEEDEYIQKKKFLIGSVPLHELQTLLKSAKNGSVMHKEILEDYGIRSLSELEGSVFEKEKKYIIENSIKEKNENT